MESYFRKYSIVLGACLIFFSCGNTEEENIGKTSITKWKDNKKSAISITYDDGIIHQFTVARPIMNNMGFSGTFYIITGKIEGATKGKFIGRNPQEIIDETATIKTNSDNFFERGSVIGFIDNGLAIEYHSNAGLLFEAGKSIEAYKLIDEGFRKLRKGELSTSNEVIFHNNVIDTTTWKDLKSYTLEGHEIASHTVTHARLAVLDEANMRYELEQSKADIEQFLGEEYTFSAECPYGTEDERVMEFAQDIYLSLRNRMPEPYMEEISRSDTLQPTTSSKEYVQWQRGPLTKTSMGTMKSWVDTCLENDNVWLILVFHGVNGIGWEPKTDEELKEYFGYMKEKEEDLWVATFADVTKYIRERKATTLENFFKDGKIGVNISSDLDSKVYDIPITLKTYVPVQWNLVSFFQQDNVKNPYILTTQKDSLGTYVLYDVSPLDGEYFLAKEQ